MAEQQMTAGESPAELVRLLERMWLIRAFEEKVSELYARGRIRGLLHLGIGQEAVAVGAIDGLSTDDLVFAGHRPHAHALAKGADPARLMAELAGRTTGYCAGRGGSMHISAPEVGFVTATGVVAGNIPLALGAAFAAKVGERRAIAAAFFGDGAGQTGAFHESLNIASLWQLPVVLVCENNGYAEFTPLSAHTKIERLTEYAKVYGIPSRTVDGNDVVAVRQAMTEAIERARRGDGPTFVEALTYRLRGHYEGDPAKYRELAELSEWKTRDPIARFAGQLSADDSLTPDDAERAEQAARATVDDAVETALAGPLPEPGEITRYVYAESA